MYICEICIKKRNKKDLYNGIIILYRYANKLIFSLIQNSTRTSVHDKIQRHSVYFGTKVSDM